MSYSRFTLEKLPNRGLSVIMISHNLPHVFSVADRITVLRGGRRVGMRRRSETTREEMIRIITGLELMMRVEKMNDIANI